MEIRAPPRDLGSGNRGYAYPWAFSHALGLGCMRGRHLVPIHILCPDLECSNGMLVATLLVVGGPTIGSPLRPGLVFFCPFTGYCHFNWLHDCALGVSSLFDHAWVRDLCLNHRDLQGNDGNIPWSVHVEIELLVYVVCNLIHG